MEEDIKILEEYCRALQGKHLDNRVRAIENLINRNKELEEERNKLLRRNEWYKEYYECFSIPKSKVQEMIEELETITLIKLTKEVEEENHTREYMSGYRTGKENAYKELLEKE